MEALLKEKWQRSFRALPQQQKPYFLWYEYLKRSPEYRRCCDQGGGGECDPLYAYFGNVHRIAFDEWWEEFQWLFMDKPPWFTVERVDSTDDHDRLDFGSTVFVAVNLLMPTRTLSRDFRRLLREAIHRKRGRPAWDDTTASFPLEMRPTERMLNALEHTLQVYDLWLKEQNKPKKERLSLWKIGEELGVCPSQTSDQLSFVYQRRIMTAAVSRYVRHADALIKNVVIGIFPKKTRPPAGRKKAWWE